MTNIELAKNIVRVIVKDIQSRKGIGDEYDQIEDPIKDEMEEDWYWLVREILEKGDK